MLFLLAVVSLFRNTRDGIFWAAVAFFVAHTVLAARRYLRERSVRSTATVVHHHQAHPPVAPIVFLPQPINSLITLKNTSQQTKKAV